MSAVAEQQTVKRDSSALLLRRGVKGYAIVTPAALHEIVFLVASARVNMSLTLRVIQSVYGGIIFVLSINRNCQRQQKQSEK
jgi:hypothetical protein